MNLTVGGFNNWTEKDSEKDIEMKISENIDKIWDKYNLDDNDGVLSKQKT